MVRYLGPFITIMVLIGALSLGGCTRARSLKDRIKDDMLAIGDKAHHDIGKIDRRINDN